MARRIEAITAFRPRLELGDPATAQRYMELVTQRTTLSPGVVKNVQESEVEALISLLLDGRPVHTGTTIYTPSIDLDGSMEIKIRVDRRILEELNLPGRFRGRIANAENIGKTANDLVAQWNAAHPDNLVVD
jgi:hypothetical protein